MFLHGYAPDGHDSDVDVAVSRQSIGTVDLLAKSGTFGRLLQRIDYDVPWCRYYVLEADEPGRRYRQLDVACDPWGIGRYGRAVSIALANRRRIDGMSVPGTAAEALYLAVKRARKGAQVSWVASTKRSPTTPPQPPICSARSSAPSGRLSPYAIRNRRECRPGAKRARAAR